MSPLARVALIVVCLVLVCFATLATLRFCFRKPEQGAALVRSGFGGTRVSFSGMFAVPVLHRLESVDVTLKQIRVRRFGEGSLETKDKVRLHAHVAMAVRINPTEHDVLNVVRSIGSERASDEAAISLLFGPPLEEALVASAKLLTFEQIEASPETLKLAIYERMAEDLNGFLIESIAMDHLAKPDEPPGRPSAQNGNA